MPGPGALNYHFDDVHSHGATLKGQAASLEAEYHAIMADVNAAADFWGGSRNRFQQFVTELNQLPDDLLRRSMSMAARSRPSARTVQSLDQTSKADGRSVRDSSAKG
jgi:hypothetical protein